MDQRERWQALQSHLGAARAFFDAGDRTRALERIDAALAIDPDFLAAHSLRERILTAPPSAPAAAVSGVPAAESRPLVSTEGYARFEERARRRRVDRRVDAARAAIAKRRVKDAAAALDEIRELDPNLPDLAVLTAQLGELRAARTRPHGGPWLAAAATFAIGVLGATWLQESGRLASNPIAPPAPAPLVASEPSDAIGTTGADTVDAAAAPTDLADIAAPAPETVRDVVPVRAPDAVPPAVVRATEPEPPTPPVARVALMPSQIAAPAPPPMPQPFASPAVQQSVAPPQPPTVANAAAPAPVVPSAVPADRVLPVPAPVDDDRLIRDALQRYRAAYEDLDAHSAQAVWPAVNQAALARAFDGLESQALTFDSCNVQLRGESASATCHGTARYVPKVGSREPHVEPRVWTFTLRKNDGDWKIDSARAQR